MAEKTPQILGFPRSSLIVVTNEGTVERPRLRMRRPGVVPLDKSLHFKWFQGESWRNEPVTRLDQLQITDRSFGAPVIGVLKFSDCLPLHGVQISGTGEESHGKVAWLASCSASVLAKLPPAGGQEVTANLSASVLESKHYRYRFKPKNNMLFESIELKYFQDDQQSMLPFAHDSDLLIYADVRNFFTMQFDSSDIESLMRSTRFDEFGALATIQFYLKILFFKITLDLDTDVAFYQSSAHIPMVLTLPKNAEKRLNPKSGILYSFVLDEGVSFDETSRMPSFDPKADQSAGGMDGFCDGEECKYSVRFKRTHDGHSSEFSMNLQIPKSLVARGMYPHYVDDAVQNGKEMGWRFSKKQQTEKRRGLYFEVSRLPPGEHAWDLWLGLKP